MRWLTVLLLSFFHLKLVLCHSIIFAEENPDCKDQKADISCSSANGKKKVCTVPKARTVVHVRSTSKDCKYGLTYGLSADGIWVSLGCGGTFSVCYIPGMSIFLKKKKSSKFWID